MATASKGDCCQLTLSPSTGYCCCHPPSFSTIVVSRPQPQINFDSQKKGDILNDCLITVDETDFCVLQKGTETKGNAFTSHKYAGKSALRYELGMSILGGDLVWIRGPYPVGKYTDIKTFNKVLHHFLDPGEQVKADKGYPGHPDKIKCPQNVGDPAEKWAMQGRVRAHHKMLNGWLNNWGILSQVYRPDSCGMAMFSRRVRC
jgi:hypothetical protein